MENFDLIKYLAEGKLLKENKDNTFAGDFIDINELKAFKPFIISELDKIVKEQAEEGENLYGEPFDANKYEELKNSINSSTTIDDIGVIVEDYLYENIYEKEYEVKDFFKYIYKTFKKVYKKSDNEDEAKQNAIEKINQYIKNGSKGSLNLSNAPITSLPDNLKVEGNLDISRTKITSLPNNLQVGSLYAGYTAITSLPDDLKVENFLEVGRTKITSLPNNLQIKGVLDISYTKITSLPKDLQVGKDLYLYNTPLSRKYSQEEIRQMVPGVKGYIFK
jgi:hypothetical protein